MDLSNEIHHLKVGEVRYLQRKALDTAPQLAYVVGRALETFEEVALEQNPDIAREYQATLRRVSSVNPNLGEMFEEDILRDILDHHFGETAVVPVRLTDTQLHNLRGLISVVVEMDRNAASDMDDNPLFRAFLSRTERAHREETKSEIFAGFLEDISLGSYLLSTIDNYLGQRNSQKSQTE